MNKIDFTLKAAIAEDFSKIYTHLNSHMSLSMSDIVDSRNGETFELLNFKTELTNPLKRCIGTSGRDMNVFFLLAEAMWIWGGKKDVEFLNIFNSNMKQFSDDGKVFHAPYGYRLRHYGRNSFSNCNNCQEIDQIRLAINMLSGIIGDGKETRRTALSIWNPELDLGRDSKDLPCNDMLFFQIRNNKLHITIANRSNDLHWGLPTNIFQFSFLLESLSLILGTEIGTQTHNSKSLHIYKSNPITQNMIDFSTEFDLYDFVSPSKIDFEFSKDEKHPIERLVEFDSLIENSIGLITKLNNKIVTPEQFVELCSSTLHKSNYLLQVTILLGQYILYKNKTVSRLDTIKNIAQNRLPEDVRFMSLNFLFNRLKEEQKEEALEYLSTLHYSDEQLVLIGKI